MIHLKFNGMYNPTIEDIKIYLGKRFIKRDDLIIYYFTKEGTVETLYYDICGKDLIIFENDFGLILYAIDRGIFSTT